MSSQIDAMFICVCRSDATFFGDILPRLDLAYFRVGVGVNCVYSDDEGSPHAVPLYYYYRWTTGVLFARSRPIS